MYGYYREFAQNAFNQAKRLGLLDIDKAELLYAEKVNNVYAPKYYEFNRYYDSGTNYACYKTITDMETETGEYFGNGTNFSLVLMIQESSGWKSEAFANVHVISEAFQPVLRYRDKVMDLFLIKVNRITLR